jgi:hypothetical protein
VSEPEYHNLNGLVINVPQPASGRLNNRQDNLPLIEEATEREPRGSRFKNLKHIINYLIALDVLKIIF